MDYLVCYQFFFCLISCLLKYSFLKLYLCALLFLRFTIAAALDFPCHMWLVDSELQVPQAMATSPSTVCSSFVQPLAERSCCSHLSALMQVGAAGAELLLSPQAALLNSFPAIFDELLQMFTVQEVAEFVRGTLGSMPSTVHIGQSMDVVKLQSIARTVDSRLFSFSGELGSGAAAPWGFCSASVGSNSLLNANRVGNCFSWQPHWSLHSFTRLEQGANKTNTVGLILLFPRAFTSELESVILVCLNSEYWVVLLTLFNTNTLQVSLW